MTTPTFTGVQASQIGELYDCAIGYDPGTGTVNMVGYVVAQGGAWETATDIQDEQHLVTVASPNQTDRFTRYPKISQGDWSGGERQVNYVAANRYYASQGLETAYAGALQLIGRYTQVTWPANVQNIFSLPRGINADMSYVFIGSAAGGSAGNYVAIDSHTLGVTIGTVGTTANGVQEIVAAGDDTYMAMNMGGAPVGIYKKNGNVLATNDNVVQAGLGCRSMAYFNGGVWYLVVGNYNQLRVVAYPFPGAGPGTVKSTPLQMEAGYVGLCDSPSGLIVLAGEGVFTIVYRFDGTSLTLVAYIRGIPVDLVTVAGTTFILTSGEDSVHYGQPIIWQLQGSTLSVFDDFRVLPPDFQGVSGGSFSRGRLDGEGRHLFLSWVGMRVKRYDLATGAVCDVGHPAMGSSTLTFHNMAAMNALGSFCEVGSGNLIYCLQTAQTPQAGASGWLQTSYLDAGAPDVVKVWRSVEVGLAQPLPAGASVGVSYRLDNVSSWTSLTVSSTGTNDLMAIFPPWTKGRRCQIQLTLTANSSGQGPVIRSHSVSATLGRVWKGVLSCRRNQQTRQQIPDPQGSVVAGLGPAQSLIGNLFSAYTQSSGMVWVMVPDETAPGGVLTASATIEEMTRECPAGMSPALYDSEGLADMEGDLHVTLVERL